MTEINFFKKNGYVCFNNPVLNAEEINLLSKFAKNLFENFPINAPGYINGDNGVLGIENIVIYDQNITQLLSKIITFPKHKKMLTEILGNDYKVWAINFRRSSINDSGLYLHQDGIGQVNLAILLDDNPKGDGATAILPESHLIQDSIKKMKLEVPSKFINWFKFIFKPLAGKKGDIAIFSNRVWHGRFSNKGSVPHDVILFGFFPSGYSYNEPWPYEFIKLTEGTNFGEMLATPDDFNSSKGVSDCNTRELGTHYQSPSHGYSMLIENELYLKSISYSLKLQLSLFFIIWIAASARLVKAILKIDFR